MGRGRGQGTGAKCHSKPFFRLDVLQTAVSSRGADSIQWGPSVHSAQYNTGKGSEGHLVHKYKQGSPIKTQKN